ncbi:hypothetical protein DQ04_14921000 [Trypanosoma grayi]|uniref:hypothetical protein n=1 Tax=Trypanosoma grayi TaxID=71804 RepID=UPI0004F43192|nr:hypothetical protein DQ04_14921000 [Trypanosoma grayi]KEG06266.1 hypothetical protein DQ04_14921000 [Trypanosoma grayi]
MLGGSVTSDRLLFRLTPCCGAFQLPPLLRHNGEPKYEAGAELLVKWLAGASHKRHTVFPIDLTQGAPDSAPMQDGQLKVQTMPVCEVAFETRMQYKPRRKRDKSEVVYKKKMMQVEVLLLLRKRPQRGETSGRCHERLLQDDVEAGNRVCSFSVAKCTTDLRDFLPCDGAPHRVRLCMQREGDYLDVTCSVKPVSGATAMPTLERLTSEASSTASSTAASATTTTGDAASSTASSWLRDTEVLVESLRPEPSREVSLTLPLVGAQANNRAMGDSNTSQTSAVEVCPPVILMAPMLSAELSVIHAFCDASAQEVAQLRQHGEGSALRPPFSPLRQVIEKGVSCEQQFEEGDPLKLFTALFPSSPQPSALMPALHRNRRDVDYPPVHMWTEAEQAHPHVAYYAVTFNMRLRKDQCIPAEEYGVAVGAGDRVVAHVMCVAPTAPVVGKDARLEFLVEIMSGGLVHAVVFPCVPGKLRFLLRSLISSKLTKLEALLQKTLREVAQSTGINTAAASVTRTPAAVSEADLALLFSSSLDPNMWCKLRDPEILSRAPLVVSILKRFQQVELPPPRVCDSLLQVLERVICLHHNCAPVVLHVTLTLMRIAAERGSAADLAKVSPTLASTLCQVYALYPLESLFEVTTSPSMSGSPETSIAEARGFLDALEAGTAALQEQRRRELLCVRDVWHLLEISLTDRQTATDVVLRMRDERRLLSSQHHCHLLNAALSMHMDCAPIAHSILGIMLHNYRFNKSSFFDELHPISADFVAAIRRAIVIHGESFLRENSTTLVVDFDAFGEALEQRALSLTFFERHFQPVLDESPLFTCSVRLVGAEADADGTTEVPLTVTMSFLCVGDSVYPLSHVYKLRMYRRWWWMPALCLSLRETGDATSLRQSDVCRDIEVVTFRRSELVEVLLRANSNIAVDR